MIHEKHKEWLTARALDPALAEKLGIETTRDASGFWLTVPYNHAGEVVNHKYRQTAEKRHRMDPDAPLSLWNADCLPEAKGGTVIITEGEWDALAAIQCGFRFTVSVPNGAPAKQTDEPETAKRYDWVWRHLRELDEVATFILATDGDGPGANLAADIASLLGADRCRFVEYPFPAKDLNEVLLEHGPERLMQLLNESKPYPIKGLYAPSDFPERGEIRSYSVGIDPIEEYLRIVPGTLTVVTGFANMGKSTMMNAIIGHALLNHFPVCVGSFETDVKPILIDGLRMAMIGCGSHELTKWDTSDVDEIIEQRLRIITQSVDEDAEMALEDVLAYARTAVVRDGCKLIVIDPWNEIEHKRRRDETETDYISRALRAIKRFAKQYDVAFWLVAHPSKPQHGSKNAPGLYDISGSANWANKADYGLTYHRPKFDVNEAKIIVSKVRMGLPGKRGEVSVTYDFRASRFRKLEGYD